MDIVVNSDIFDSVGIPESPVVCCEKSGNFWVRWVRDDIGNFNKQRNPVILWWSSSAGSFEVFSVDVEFSIANVNENVELVLSIWGEEVVFRFVNESDVSAVFVKSWVCSLNFVESEISELRKNVLIGSFEGFIRVEFFNFIPWIDSVEIIFRIESFLINLQNGSLGSASIIMSFEVNIAQEWDELNLNLEVMNINIDSVLNSWDPLVFKSSEMVVQSWNYCNVSWMSSEVL